MLFRYEQEGFIRYARHKPCTDCTPDSQIGPGQIPTPPPPPPQPPLWLSKPGAVISLINLMTGQYLNITGASKAQTSSGVSSASPAAQFKVVKLSGSMPNFEIVLQNVAKQECLLIFGYEGMDFSSGGSAGTYPDRCDGLNPQEIFSVQLVSPSDCQTSSAFADKQIIRLVNNMSKQALIAYGIFRTPPLDTNEVGSYPNRTGCNPQNLWAVEVVSPPA